ncbi:hypothetical protein WKT22_01471 [Candidatus Lokiarchaeum ossiferum]
MASEELLITSVNEPILQSDPNLVDEQMLDQFSSKIKACFPTFVASVVTDMDGFPLHADVGNSMDENLLALSAVVSKRRIIDVSGYHRLVRPLNKNTRLLVLLEKSRENYANVGIFEEIVKNENPLE